MLTPGYAPLHAPAHPLNSRSPCIAYIALGANFGDAKAALEQAVVALSALPFSRLQKLSSFYKTAPIDSAGPDYLNAVAEISTSLSAPDLLGALQAIENQAGRERPYRNAPRTLDLDILLYGSAFVASAHLTLPHPRMFERAFVLIPLAEIAPQIVTAQQLLAVQAQTISRL
ncbi:2-amino-4-hydroxy-6-hydroxymethyldihydropteridine pyrophosphokinase [Polaromonas vacuolata]|uniref:2-amino-4-hydroxy-6-hydroxymethyldihydropteridine pyrophosphokinase n=1 Tax=Polaromonas vacuolata TaxID=37448 RepID=A0A6H2H794_9BURK|nr:2-amino-4-hydroxy-6-hydroxymethyldihydropteridine diphosphokinase [Polaromonas vacuolata]QJC55751.1 2-amino-4-hydroxy-6-hydroxymethyldihydropteridine pyrophosphokinase [Polaromonas vacuolata]